MKAVLLACLLMLVPTAASAQTPAATRPVTQVPADDHAGDAHHADHDPDHVDDAHAHLGHAGVDLTPSEIKGDLAIFSAIVFLLLVVILRKFAWGPIAAGLEKREGHIAHEIAAAEMANLEARGLLSQYQAKLDAAQAEVRTILDDARRNAERAHQDLLAKAKAEAAAETDRAKREIESAKDAAMRDLATVATDQALALAGKLLQQKLQPSDHARLIDDALAKFPKSTANLN